MSNLKVQRTNQTSLAEEPKHLNELSLGRPKPTPNQLVIELLVDSAIDSANPVSSLILLQHDQRFRYAGGQRMILASLARVERAAFQELELTDRFSERLTGCISHLGELFKNFIDSSHGNKRGAKKTTALQKLGPSALTDELCTTWAYLMTDQLTYLSLQRELGLEQLSMGLHACAVLQHLMDWWSRPDAPELPERAGHAVVQTMEQLLCSPAIADLLARDRSLDGATLLEGLIHLAASLGDPVILEQLIDLLPGTFAVCQELCPEEFCRDDLDDLDEQSESPDYYQEHTSMSADDHGTDNKGEEIDADSPEAASLEAELRETTLQDAVIDAWERVFRLNLLAFNLVPERSHRVDILTEILRSCPSEADVWAPILDALIAASHKSYKEFLPVLLTRAMADPLGGLIVLQIADFTPRTKNTEAVDPFPALVVALRRLPRQQRNDLLKDCKDLLWDQTDLFSKPAVTKQALKRLHTELKKPPRLK